MRRNYFSNHVTIMYTGRFESYKVLIYYRGTFSFRGSIREAKTINDHPSKMDIC